MLLPEEYMPDLDTEFDYVEDEEWVDLRTEEVKLPMRRTHRRPTYAQITRESVDLEGERG